MITSAQKALFLLPATKSQNKNSLTITEFCEVITKISHKLIWILETEGLINQTREIVAQLKKFQIKWSTLLPQLFGILKLRNRIWKISITDFQILVINETNPKFDIINCQLKEKDLETVSAELISRALLQSLESCVANLPSYLDKGGTLISTIKRINHLTDDIREIILKVKEKTTLFGNIHSEVVTLQTNCSVSIWTKMWLRTKQKSTPWGT